MLTDSRSNQFYQYVWFYQRSYVWSEQKPRDPVRLSRRIWRLCLLKTQHSPRLRQEKDLTLQDPDGSFSGRVVQLQSRCEGATAQALLWSGLVSFFASEEMLTGGAHLQLPPVPVHAREILLENLPEAWSTSVTTASDIAKALLARMGVVLPWFTVRETIGKAFNARWLEWTLHSASWPRDYAGARQRQDEPPHTLPERENAPQTAVQNPPGVRTRSAEAVVAMKEMQDLDDHLVALRKATVGLKLIESVRGTLTV